MHCWFWHLVPLHLHCFQQLFPFCVFFNIRTLLNVLSSFLSSGVFYWHCVIVRMTQSRPSASPQAQAGSTRNPCTVVPAPHLNENTFLLTPFPSPSPLSKPLHYRDAVTFQGLQWACLCSSFFFSDPGGSLAGAESPRTVTGVQISNKLLYLCSPASYLFFFFHAGQVEYRHQKTELAGCGVWNSSADLRFQTNSLRGIQEMLRCIGTTTQAKATAFLQPKR